MDVLFVFGRVFLYHVPDPDGADQAGDGGVGALVRNGGADAIFQIQPQELSASWRRGERFTEVVKGEVDRAGLEVRHVHPADGGSDALPEGRCWIHRESIIIHAVNSCRISPSQQDIFLQIRKVIKPIESGEGVN